MTTSTETDCQELITLLGEYRIDKDTGVVETLKRVLRRAVVVPVDPNFRIIICSVFWYRGFAIGWTGWKVRHNHTRGEGYWMACRAEPPESVFEGMNGVDADSLVYTPPHEYIEVPVTVTNFGLSYQKAFRLFSQAREQGFEEILDLIDKEYPNEK